MCHRGKVFGRHEVLFDSGHGRRRQVQCVGRRSDRDHCGGRGGTVGPRRTGTCRRGLVAAGMNGRLGRGWGCRVDGCCLHRLGRMVGADLGEERGDARRLGHAGLGSGDDQETDVEEGGSPVIATKAPTQNGSTTPTTHRGRRWSVGYSASAIPRGCLEPRIIRWRARGRETRGLGPSMTSLCIAKPAHSLRPRRPPADVTIALEKDPISIVQHHSPHRRHINTHFKNHAQPHTAMPRPSRMFLQVDCC